MKLKSSVYLFSAIFCLTLVFFLVYFFSETKKKPQVVLFVTIDSLRADHLSCNGYKRLTSKNIDELANGGVRFEKVFANSTWTQPSNTAILTGNYSCNYYSKNARLFSIEKAKWTIPKIAKKAGYKTIFITDHPLMLKQIRGFDDQFDLFLGFQGSNPESVTSAAMSAIDSNEEKNLFIWLYYKGAHVDYSPSRPFSEEFYKDKLYPSKELPISNGQYRNFFNNIPAYLAENNITDTAFYRAKYDGAIAVTDAYLGNIFTHLKYKKLFEKSCILITADHGEGFGEHEVYFNHGFHLFDYLLRVPLVISYPELLPTGKVIKSEISQLDVLNTLMEILDIKENLDTEGISFLPQILGEDIKLHDHMISDLGDSSMVSVRTERYKLIYLDFIKLTPESFREEYKKRYRTFSFYNLLKDPEEKNAIPYANLNNGEKQEYDRLKSILLDHLWFCMEKLQQNLTLPTGNKEKIDGEAIEQLKKLGYME